MSIPKKIHYCWFGGGPKPPIVERCLASWARFIPEYEIIEWNEQTFDIEAHPFTSLAYKNKKWAFLSDYVRMWAVFHQGGIYLDSDCEVFHSLDGFLKHRAFTGFERYLVSMSPFTACFGAEKEHPWVKMCLDYYSGVDLSNPNIFIVTNTDIVSRYIMGNYSAKLQDKFQNLNDGFVLYPSPVLCTPNHWHRSYVVHHFNGSWLGVGGKKLSAKAKAIESILRFLPISITSKLILAVRAVSKLKKSFAYPAESIV